MTSAPLVVGVPTEELVDALGSVPGADIVLWKFDGPPPVNHFDIVVPPYLEHARVLERLNGVSARLVQSQSIGYEGITKYLPPGLPFANATTVHETSTAELALALTLAMQRGLTEFVLASERHEWQLRWFPSLADRRVLIVGFGAVGQAIEERLIPFEAEVTRVASTARVQEGSAGRPVQVHGFADLHALVPHAEIIILAVPLTEQTHHLVDAAFLSAMADNALLVNVARGRVVDTAALVAEVTSGRIRAAVDVTDPEPLPADHPLWNLPNVLISPHVGGASSAMLPRMTRLIRRQIERMLAGEPPENLVIQGTT